MGSFFITAPPIELQSLPASHRGGEDKGSEGQHIRVNKKQASSPDKNMKFSHSIQFNAVPDWSSNYISYSNLKKL